jgi:ribosomal protein S18 acetylase RimI-like enzyme
MPSQSIDHLEFLWAAPEQLPALWQFENSWGVTWPHPREYFAESIRTGRTLVARREGSIIGYLVYEVLWGNTPFLSLLKVHSQSQRIGVGTRLVGLLENRLRDAGFRSCITSSESTNPNTKEFFPKLGFNHIGELSMHHGGEMFYLKILPEISSAS